MLTSQEIDAIAARLSVMITQRNDLREDARIAVLDMDKWRREMQERFNATKPPRTRKLRRV